MSKPRNPNISNLLLSVKGQANGSNLVNGKTEISRPGPSQDQTTTDCKDDVYLLVLLTVWLGGSTNILMSLILGGHASFLSSLDSAAIASPLHLLPTEDSSKRALFIFLPAQPGIAETRDSQRLSGAPARPSVSSLLRREQIRVQGDRVFIFSLCRWKRTNPATETRVLSSAACSKADAGKLPWLESSRGW